jgi:lactate dehydrogenase-like 2-hydroxyacid dehydrogenase
MEGSWLDMPQKKVLLLCTPVAGIKDVLPRLEAMFEVVQLPDACDLDFQENNYKNVWAVFTNPNRARIYLGHKILNSMPNLQIICTASTGTVHIDYALAESRGIDIISLKDETDFLSKVTSTAELAFTLMLTVIRKIIPATNDVINGGWDCDKFIGRQVGDLKIGVLGFGRLGKLFSHYSASFGAEVKFYDPYVQKDVQGGQAKKIEDLGDFLSDLDVLSIHIHATTENNNFVSNEFLDMCSENLVIINTARGEVVDEDAMVEFLIKNPLAHYATDVVSDEVVGRCSSPIISYLNRSFPSGNVTVTPHMGGMSEGARFLAYNKSIDLFEQYMEKSNA